MVSYLGTCTDSTIRQWRNAATVCFSHLASQNVRLLTCQQGNCGNLRAGTSGQELVKPLLHWVHIGTCIPFDLWCKTTNKPTFSLLFLSNNLRFAVLAGSYKKWVEFPLICKQRGGHTAFHCASNAMKSGWTAQTQCHTTRGQGSGYAQIRCPAWPLRSFLGSLVFNARQLGAPISLHDINARACPCHVRHSWAFLLRTVATLIGSCFRQLPVMSLYSKT